MFAFFWVFHSIIDCILKGGLGWFLSFDSSNMLNYFLFHQGKKLAVFSFVGVESFSISEQLQSV